MIGEKIQTALEAVIPNTYVAIADEGVETPFCIHSERQVPIRLKEGVIGYTYECEVMIIDDSPDNVETLKKSVISALEALEGSSDDDYKITSVDYTGDEPGFDKESKLFSTILLFNIDVFNN